MMFEHLGHKDAHDGIMSAIDAVLVDENLRTGDLKGKADTVDTVTCGKAIADAVLTL